MAKGRYTNVFVVTLETRGRALMADDRVLDQSAIVGGNHYSVRRLGLNWQRRLAMGLDQSVDWKALSLHGNPLCVHLHLIGER